MSDSLQKQFILLLAVFWWSTLLTVAAALAPSLFFTLPSKLAGDAVGVLLAVQAYVGLTAGLLLLAWCGRDSQWAMLLCIALASVIVGHWLIQPAVHELRPFLAQADARADFARLHLFALLAYLLCFLAVGRMVWISLRSFSSKPDACDDA